MSYEADQAAIERRRRLAEIMMSQGAQQEPTQMVGPMVVPQTPLTALSKIAQQLSGAYIGRKAEERANELETERYNKLAGINWNSPDAVGQLAQVDPKLAVEMAMKRSASGGSDGILAIKEALDDKTGKLKYIGFDRAGGIKEYGVEAPNTMRWQDFGGGYSPVFTKGGPGNIPQAGGVNVFGPAPGFPQGTQVTPLGNDAALVGDASQYSPADLAAINADRAAAQQPSAQVPFIPKTPSPTEQRMAAQQARANARADTQLGLSLEDQQFQRENAARQREQFERQQSMSERNAALQEWKLDNPNYAADQKRIKTAEEGLAKLNKSIDKYYSLLEKTSYADRKNPLTNADLKAAWTDVTTNLRGPEFLNTGVLNPGEMPMLEGAVADPTSIVSPRAYASDKALKAQLDNLKQSFKDKVEVVKKTYSPTSPPPIGRNAPASDDARKAELEALRKELYGND